MSGKPAARVTDPTACPLPGHGTNPIAAGSPNVLFDGLPAARQGDTSACGGALSGNVIPTVLINGMPAATVGTVGSHGNVVVSGSGTVVVGTSHSPAAFTAPVPLPSSFNIQAQILDQLTGQPLRGLPFTVRLEDGSEVYGITDKNGLTSTLGQKSNAQQIQIIARPGWILQGE